MILRKNVPLVVAAPKGQRAYEGCICNSRELVNSRQQLLLGAHHLWLFVILGSDQGKVHRMQIARLKSRLHTNDLLQASNQQPRADRQDESQSQFSNHQKRAQATARKYRRSSPPALQSFAFIGPCRLQSRNHSSDQAREKAYSQRKN